MKKRSDVTMAEIMQIGITAVPQINVIVARLMADLNRLTASLSEDLNAEDGERVEQANDRQVIYKLFDMLISSRLDGACTNCAAEWVNNSFEASAKGTARGLTKAGHNPDAIRGIVAAMP